MIQPVESLEITVLVDNGTDSLSTNPGFVETAIRDALNIKFGGPSCSVLRPPLLGAFVQFPVTRKPP
jgi:hypothetical protein